MSKLSVCMIVKDEEKTLGRILSQAKKFADEIIVVDTGSTDKTIMVAKRYTDKIYNFEWCDDFSKARNYSLKFATCDYTMWLDADDYITPKNIEKIKALKNAERPADVYMLKYAMGGTTQKPNLEYFRERIFKTSLNLRFEGCIHEAIVPTGIVQYLNITIFHKKEKPINPKRNFKIYTKLIKSKVPLTPRDKYYYGRELFYLGYYKKAIKVLSNYLKNGDTFLPNLVGASIVLADCYMATNNTQKSIDCLLNFIKTSTPNSEMCCKLANAFEKIGKTNLSIFWFKNALNCTEIVGCFNSPDYDKFIPFMELCRLTYPLNLTESKKYHTLACKIHPNHPAVIYNKQFFS